MDRGKRERVIGQEMKEEREGVIEQKDEIGEGRERKSNPTLLHLFHQSLHDHLTIKKRFSMYH